MLCLRCGTEFEGTQSFCKACAAKMQEPLEDSPYLHTQIVLPNRRPAPAPKRPDPKKEKKEKKERPLRWILSTLFLGLLCIALLLQGGWLFGQWLKGQSELGRAETQRAALQQEIDLLQAQLAEAEQTNVELKAAVDRLETELVLSQIDLVDLQQKIQVLSQQIVFVDEGETTFHKQGCVKFEAEEFRAWIRDEAISRAYEPCELCLP